jgi:hypothetical protein
VGLGRCAAVRVIEWRRIAPPKKISKQLLPNRRISWSVTVHVSCTHRYLFKETWATSDGQNLQVQWASMNSATTSEGATSRAIERAMMSVSGARLLQQKEFSFFGNKRDDKFLQRVGVLRLKTHCRS